MSANADTAPAPPLAEGQAFGPAAPATPQLEAMQQQGEDPPQQQRQRQQQEGEEQDGEEKDNPRMVLETTNIPDCNARTARGFHSLILQGGGWHEVAAAM